VARREMSACEIVHVGITSARVVKTNGDIRRPVRYKAESALDYAADRCSLSSDVKFYLSARGPAARATV